MKTTKTTTFETDFNHARNLGFFFSDHPVCLEFQFALRLRYPNWAVYPEQPWELEAW